MKLPGRQCLAQDRFFEDNPQYCVGVIPKARSFNEVCNFLADKLLDALVHDTQDKNISFAVGRAIPMWKLENYFEANQPDALTRFHKDVRVTVLRKMIEKMKPENADQWQSDLNEIEGQQ